MDTGTFRGLITFVLLVAFIGITWWAYSKRRKPDFDEAANLPFADDKDEEEIRKQHAEQEEQTKSRHDGGDKNV